MVRVALLLVVAGCSDRSEVVITGADRHLTPEGLEVRPADLSGHRIQVYAGGEVVPAEPVTGDASGRVVIPDVPEGPIVIAVEQDGFRWYWGSDSHDVTWTWRQAGRVEPRRAEVQQPVTLEVDGLAPWTDDDRLLFSAYEPTTDVVPALMPTLASGATSIAATFEYNASDAWSAAGRPVLIEDGDTVVLARRRDRSEADGRFVSTTTEVLALTAPRQASGEGLTVRGTMRPVELTRSLRVNIDHDLFHRVTGGTADRINYEVALRQQPTWLGQYRLGAPLVHVAHQHEYEPGPTSYLVPFGAPFDAGWGTYAYVRYTLSATGIPALAYAFAFAPLDTDLVVVTPPAPFATEVRLGGHGVIEGASFASDVRSPILLEVVSAADGFTAYVERQYMPDPRTETGEIVAWLRSDTNAIEVPPGVFQAGERYMLVILTGTQDDQRYGYSVRRFGPFQLVAP